VGAAISDNHIGNKDSRWEYNLKRCMVRGHMDAEKNDRHWVSVESISFSVAKLSVVRSTWISSLYFTCCYR